MRRYDYLPTRTAKIKNRATQMLAGTFPTGTHSWLVWMQNGAAALEDSWWFLIKLNIHQHVIQQSSQGCWKLQKFLKSQKYGDSRKSSDCQGWRMRGWGGGMNRWKTGFLGQWRSPVILQWRLCVIAHLSRFAECAPRVNPNENYGLGWWWDASAGSSMVRNVPWGGAGLSLIGREALPVWGRKDTGNLSIFLSILLWT